MSRVLEGVQSLVDDAALITGSEPRLTSFAHGPKSDTSVEYVLFPRASRARAMLPVSRRAASGALVRFCDSNGWGNRAVRVSLGAMLRAGATRWLPDRLTLPAAAQGTVYSVLRDHFGRDIALAIPVGAARANRKTVIQVLSGEGKTLGFAKVARSPLARELVVNEARTLRFLDGRLSTVMLPRVLLDHCTTDWHLLLLSPLPTSLIRTRRPGRVPSKQMHEVFEVGKVRQGEMDSHLQTLEGRALSHVPRDSRAALRFASAVSALRDESVGRVIDLGSWHGDWGPWNMASGRRAVAVWDWERFSTDTPRGLDELHFALQRDIRSSTYDANPARLLKDATRALATAGIVDRRTAALTTGAYLAHIAGRYLEDHVTEHGTALEGQLDVVLTLLEDSVRFTARDWDRGRGR